MVLGISVTDRLTYLTFTYKSALYIIIAPNSNSTKCPFKDKEMKAQKTMINYLPKVECE